MSKSHAVYCRPYADIMSRVRASHPVLQKGLMGLLNFGKKDWKDDNNVLLFTSILSLISFGDILPVSRHWHKDWSLKWITVIALSEERDLLNAAIDYYFRSLLVSLYDLYIFYILFLLFICVCIYLF